VKGFHLLLAELIPLNPEEPLLHLVKTMQNENLLKSDTNLVIAVKSTTIDKKLISYHRNDINITGVNDKKFVEIKLEENLMLNGKTRNLEKCKCYIPSLQQKTTSLNLAATAISKNFNSVRPTTSMNVFRDTYFLDNDGTWKTLDDWREKVNSSLIETKNIRDISNRLVKTSDDFNDFDRILAILFKSTEMAKIIVNLNTECGIDQEIQLQKMVNTLVGVNKLKDVLKILETNQNNSSEAFWQKTLEDNSVVLAQLFYTPVTILRSQAYVGGKGIGNTGGNIIDFLCSNKLTRNTALVEIKTPTTHILTSIYRTGVYDVSRELSGSLAQLRASKDSLTKNYYNLVRSSDSYFEVFDPHCIVILGNIQNEIADNNDKKQSFELYRSSNKDVQIVTYDELFERIKILVELLEGKN